MKKKSLIILLIIILNIGVFSNLNSFANEKNTTVENKEEQNSSTKLMVETSNIEEVKSNENVEEVVQLAENIYIVDYVDEDSAKEDFKNLDNNDLIDNVFKDITVSILDTEVSINVVNPRYKAWGVETTGMDHYTDYLTYQNSRRS